MLFFFFLPKERNFINQTNMRASLKTSCWPNKEKEHHYLHCDRKYGSPILSTNSNCPRYTWSSSSPWTSIIPFTKLWSTQSFIPCNSASSSAINISWWVNVTANPMTVRIPHDPSSCRCYASLRPIYGVGDDSTTPSY